MRPVRLSTRGLSSPASPIRKLVPYSDSATARGVKVWHLNIGQPDIPTPKAMWDAVVNDHPAVLAYSPSTGIREMREALSDYYGRHGVELGPEDLVVTAGGSEAILMALGAVTDPGDELLIPEPMYANYIGFAALLGVRVIPVPANPEDGYRLPPRRVWEERLTGRTRAILICNPGNPTGAVYTEPELEMILEMARDWGLFVAADEVYREFCYDGLRHRSILTYREESERLIVMDSISKRFSACGARIGCLGSRNSSLIAAVTRFAQARLSPPSLGQWMATAALRLPQDYYDHLQQEYQRRRDVVVEELNNAEGVLCRVPRGAFYAMPILPVDDAEKFAVWMLEEFSDQGETVMVAPGNGFYATKGAGRREARIAYVYGEEPLRRAMKVLVKGLGQYPGRGPGQG